MLTLVPVVLAVALALGQTPTPPQTPTPEAAKPADPATSTFATDAGLILVAIKADKVADFELAIRTLQEKLAADPDPARHAIAEGWRVFKAAEPDDKGNVVYVHALLPGDAGFRLPAVTAARRAARLPRRQSC